MIIEIHEKFKKQYKKLSTNEQKNFKERLEIFKRNKFDIILNNHRLKGKHKNYNSINITGDLRAIYKVNEDSGYVFIKLGTHSQLYF